ncbi:GTP-binding protein rho1 [Psilocybe cubensis]|uniref:GTP-binding protein rho1 n=1 Tax=Psilocybe cubensis TaxID=181762 RepID=A0ACB8GX52_PSICU|nr:GTP-binding protein rho1 [Psilocybe cubensis]KAH9480045.1 GTP-binding protein rho1 [Psilocybe cubensis]
MSRSMASTWSLLYGIRPARKTTIVYALSVILIRMSSSSASPSTPPDSLDNVQEKLCISVPACLSFLSAAKRISDVTPRVIEELRKTSQRPVTPEEGMAVAQKIGAKHYLECSAKSGEGVREVFQYATRAALLSRGKGKKSHHCIVL